VQRSAAQWRAARSRQPDHVGCLLGAYEPRQVWLAHADGTRNYVAQPTERCKARAAHIAPAALGAVRKRDGPSDQFALSDALARAACTSAPPCALAPGSGALDLAASFAELVAELAAPPAESYALELASAEPTPPPPLGDGGGSGDGGGDSAGAGQWWLARVGDGVGVRFESAAFPGRFLAARAAPAAAEPRLVHREAALVAFELGLSEPGGGGGADVVRLALEPPLAEYPPLAFWLVAAAGVAPSALAPAAAAVWSEPRALLAYALNEVIDEHYAPYVCLLGAGSTGPPPKYCV
jgi:hypothetical protein